MSTIVDCTIILISIKKSKTKLTFSNLLRTCRESDLDNMWHFHLSFMVFTLNLEKKNESMVEAKFWRCLISLYFALSLNWKNITFARLCSSQYHALSPNNSFKKYDILFTYSQTIFFTVSRLIKKKIYLNKHLDYIKLWN